MATCFSIVKAVCLFAEVKQSKLSWGNWCFHQVDSL